MTIPRRQQIDLQTTPYYHCYSRCVRRAFLCGFDRLSKRDYSHRKQWLVERLAHLASVFAVDICAYAVMANHYHLVLRVDLERANAWDDDDVVKRWYRVSRTKAVELDKIPAAEHFHPDQIALWRERLCNLSWFMRCLNEPIARRANREDQCKGAFWDGRFKCKALLDSVALLTCMAYVDLNPIHAGIAKTPESSDFTSAQARLRKEDTSLMPFADETKPTAPSLPFELPDYLTLVDWTGRALRADKRGAIPAHLPPILQRVQLPPDQWIKALKTYEPGFPYFVGRTDALEVMARRLNRLWIKGVGLARVVFG